MAPDGRQLLSEPVKWKNDLAPRRFIPLRDLSRVIEESLERRRRVEEILARRNLLSVGSPSISPVVSQTQIDSPETSKPNKKRKKEETLKKNSDLSVNKSSDKKRRKIVKEKKSIGF
jgi:hypothetical protein